MFNSNYYQELKNELHHDYQNYIQELRVQLDEISKETLLSHEFMNFLNSALLQSQLNEFTPENFYFVNLLEDLSFVIESLHTQDALALIDFFTQSQYAQKFLEKPESPLESAENLLDQLEQQVMGFFYLKITGNIEQSFNFQPIFEMGDCEERIYLTKFSSYFDKSEISKQDKPAFCNSKKLNDVFVVSRDNHDELTIDQQASKIENALSMISNHSPACYEAFTQFTKVIIPIDEPGVVSYSTQELPGYSCINMFERDDIDLMDDLIHENGHHFLNYHLNTAELIIEDDDPCFYSPWRETQRPIRGIYHAYLTFFWAYQLFADLSLSVINGKLNLNQAQKKKILSRFTQEKEMLERCAIELEKAQKMGKIHKEGSELIKKFEKHFLLSDENLDKILLYISK